MKIALCAIAKNENNYIREWVEHHKKIGYTNIILYDNNDTDGERFENVIGDYIESKYVILNNVRGYYKYQIQCYSNCYNEYHKLYDWITFIDIDEFVHIDIKFNNISDFLNQSIFNKFNCIRLIWKNYDDNNLIRVENSNYSITRFTHSINIDKQSKAILRCTFNKIDNTSAHILFNNEKINSCNAEGKSVINAIQLPNNDLTYKNAYIAHYRFKTIEEFLTNKAKRGWATHWDKYQKLDIDFFYRYNKKTQEKDEYIKYLYNGELKNKEINVVEFNEKYNFGDKLNSTFLQDITNYNIKPFYYKYSEPAPKLNNVYLCIGSIINDHCCIPNSIIWGSGLINPNKIKTIKRSNIKQICAVRGPLTRNEFLKNNINCPEIYGDPALLLPYVFMPNIIKKYKYGIIPHFSNINNVKLIKFANDNNMHIIDLTKKIDYKTQIIEILECEYILSESLHGLIISEAYNIPNVWVNIYSGYEKTGVSGESDAFKYKDFYKSINKNITSPIELQNILNIKNINTLFNNYYTQTGFTINEAKKLVNACPFKLNIPLLQNE